MGGYRNAKFHHRLALFGGRAGGGDGGVHLLLLRREREHVGPPFRLAPLVEANEFAADEPVVVFHVGAELLYVQGYEHHEHEEADGGKHPFAHGGHRVRNGLRVLHSFVQNPLRVAELHAKLSRFQSGWDLQFGVEVQNPQVCKPLQHVPDPLEHLHVVTERGADGCFLGLQVADHAPHQAWEVLQGVADISENH